MKKPCDCGRIHSANDVFAHGRFRVGDLPGYRAWPPGSTVRASRAEAMLDVCPQWVA